MNKTGCAVFMLAFDLLLFSLVSCVSLRPADGQPANIQPTVHEEVIHSPDGYYSALSESSKKDSVLSLLPSVEPLPEKYGGVKISLIAAGDNLIHPNIYTDAYDRGNEEKRYDFLPVYTDVADMISSADIAFINQETVMAGAEYGYSGWPCFNCPQSLGDDLVSLGFDVINIANNHMLDRGANGLDSTIDFWREKPVTLLGGYKNEDDAKELRITEADGVKIAWLSYTYGTNGITKSADSDIVIPYIDDELILSDIARAREAADFVIVSIHWGDENVTEPNGEQRRLAELIANGGADLIIGHHPHALQPIKWIHTDRKDVLCVYSLGNFVSGMDRPINVVGGLLSLDIVSDGADGLTVQNILFTPTLFWYGMDWYGTHLYLLSDFTPSLAETCGVRIDGYSITVESAKKIVTDVIDGEYLPEYLKESN